MEWRNDAASCDPAAVASRAEKGEGQLRWDERLVFNVQMERSGAMGRLEVRSVEWTRAVL